MDKERVTHLLQSFIAKNITPQEEEELLQTLNNTQEENLVDVVSELIDSGVEENVSFEDWTALVSKSISADKPAAKVRRTSTFYRYVSAAAIIFIVGISAYFYKNYVTTSNPVASYAIEPGRNKAILITEDGNRITLDDSLNTKEVFEKNANIKSISSGEIVYNTNEGNESTSGVNILRTPRGGQYRVVLPDGTVAWLNAESELTFPSEFDNGAREVRLKGEAYFEVTSYKEKKWPFVVKSLGQQIKVLGTKFNVSAYDEDSFSTTSLLEGKVEVTNESSEKSVILFPGEKSTLNKDSKQISVHTTDVTEARAWKEGLFLFNNENLYVVMNKIARWYDVEVVYKGDFKDKAFWGTIARKEKLENLLKTLQATGVAKFKIDGRRVLVMP